MLTHQEASELSLKAFFELKPKYPNIQSIAFGPKKVKGKETSELAMIIMVVQKLPLVSLAKEQILPSEMYGYKTDVQMFGEHTKLFLFPYILPPRSGSLISEIDPTKRFRPVFPSLSTGHYAITAGTIGGIVRDAEDDKILYLLSNNHVYANCNKANIGDFILQPGAYDGGELGPDNVASLSRFITVQFINDVIPDCSYAQLYKYIGNLIAAIKGSRYRVEIVSPLAESPVNYVDCAIAQLISLDMALPENDIPEIGVVNLLREPELGEAVEKTGRTTYHRTGYVDMIGQTTQVGYGDNNIAIFTEQYATTGPFSAGGDSGSMIVASRDKAGVGLLFAGGTAADGSEITIWNSLSRVFESLKIKF